MAKLADVVTVHARQTPDNAVLTVDVEPFEVEGVQFEGGEINLLPNGKWYVGVDLFSGEMIALPRLGHRGWVPILKATTGTRTIDKLECVTPKLPTCRIPRFVEKVLAGEDVNVLVMGSSLAEGSSTSQWAGMLFSESSSVEKYKIPTPVNLKNTAVGGAPNAYQLAQTGIAIKHTGSSLTDDGFIEQPIMGAPPFGRSELFTDVDLVVLTCLANGGDYRLQNIEPICRNLRKMGLEVILTTDNPQGHPFTDFNDIVDSSLYVDHQYVLDAADRYGFEYADTAAYVVEATLRYLSKYPALQIYRDSIHMFAAEPNGRTGAPAGGYEVWARAIRSTIPVDGIVVGTVETTHTFDSGLDGFTSYGTQGVVSQVSGQLKTEKATSTNGQWGAKYDLPDLNIGDTVRVQGTIIVPESETSAVDVGLYTGGWGGTHGVVGNTGTFTFDVTLTATKVNPDLIFFAAGQDNATAGKHFFIDNVTVTVNSSVQSAAFLAREIQKEEKPLPQSKVYSDRKTPGDCAIILPQYERRTATLSATRGTLGTSPDGANSFASEFSSLVASDENILTLAAGDEACLAGYGVVAVGVIYRSVSSDPDCTFEFFANNVSQGETTLSFSQNRDVFRYLLSPTDYGNTNAGLNNPSFKLVVSAGTLRIAALVLMTAEQEYIKPEEITFIGTWSGPQLGGSPGLLGYSTDTVGDQALLRCPPEARRVVWVVANKADSKPLSHWSGQSSTQGQTNTGNSHVRLRGAHIGPGDVHVLELDETLEGGGGTANGYGLHVGGATIIYDR